ncbi:group 1 truncated hemoglobin [Paenibacillus baekrokdamisoli]|uniref:Group 1 truncated hemoglobin n=1 Tax=Paenibacillus baekrokdamisoli TaxID=1712516 RepID=A0A3G9IU69_9BACL|nr:group 1 truncated hemoglobin [Paenibacillus baekrokdamisoli]MBB3068540.1 hemoglobin [Paenibacillus baekrokdamisoli]BBH22420.1 group 1 truncated hemoglobin [Paenibacillus baekrokdamisoli]
MEQSLYAKFGGVEGLAPVVDEFYKRVLEDETVNRFFEHTDLDRLRRHQAHFLSFALGGPNQYTGKSMEKAHQGFNLQREHFQAIAKHLQGTLEHFNVSQEDIAKVFELIVPLESSILHK